MGDLQLLAKYLLLAHHAHVAVRAKSGYDLFLSRLFVFLSSLRELGSALLFVVTERASRRRLFVPSSLAPSLARTRTRTLTRTRTRTRASPVFALVLSILLSLLLFVAAPSLSVASRVLLPASSPSPSPSSPTASVFLFEELLQRVLRQRDVVVELFERQRQRRRVRSRERLA